MAKYFFLHLHILIYDIRMREQLTLKIILYTHTKNKICCKIEIFLNRIVKAII